ncbi:hypothetical protein [Methanorbis rubei]|uniref:Uncharacterized protein n=1 Tax=Methanorbis rubei TaxID=3028300 RepID=A0AAE4MHR2_9EURY|nr:hypothetical protein [Methanocorpusculaceae archaeon Cs1]
MKVEGTTIYYLGMACDLMHFSRYPREEIFDAICDTLHMNERPTLEFVCFCLEITEVIEHVLFAPYRGGVELRNAVFFPEEMTLQFDPDTSESVTIQLPKSVSNEIQAEIHNHMRPRRKI